MTMPPLKVDIGEIAPAGSLRAAVNIANAALVRVDERTGELRGPSVDLAQSLAKEIGCPLLLEAYPSAAAILAADDSGAWDIAFIAADPSRTDRFAFSPPYAFVTATCMVPANAAISSVAQVDAPGFRIAAARGAAYTKQLERQIRHASIVYAEGPAAAIDLLKAGSSDAAAGLKDFLQNAAAQDASLRVVDDAFFAIPQTIAIRKGSRAAPFIAAFVGRWVQDHG